MHLLASCASTPLHALSALQQAQSKPRKVKVNGTRSKPGGVSTQEKRKLFQAENKPMRHVGERTIKLGKRGRQALAEVLQNKRMKPIGVSRDDSVSTEDADGSDSDAPQSEVRATTHAPRITRHHNARTLKMLKDTHTPRLPPSHHSHSRPRTAR